MSWHKAKLGDLGRIVTGKTPSRTRMDYFGNDYPFVMPSDFGFMNYYCRDVAEGVSEAGFEKHKNHTIPRDAALCVCIGNTIGKCAIASKPCLTNQQINSVIAGPSGSPKFIYYLLCNMREQIRSVGLGGGAAQPIINKSKFSALEVRVPDLPTQQAIVEPLSAYDDLIDNNRRRISLLERAAFLLYREWFVYFRFPGHEHVKFTDGVPEEWEQRKFDDVCKAVGGGTPKTSKSEYWSDGDIPWYTPTDVTRNSCLALVDSASKITEAGLRGSSARMLPSGTVLMTSRASVGFFGIIDTPSCTNQGFISILPHDSWARMYLLYNLMHRVEEIRSHASGSTYREISKGKFRALPVLLPGELLLREFEAQASTLHAQVRNLHATNQRLARARDLLLPRLMNGELVV